VHSLGLVDALEIVPVVDDARQEADHLGSVETAQERGVDNAVQLESPDGEDGAVDQQLGVHNFRHSAAFNRDEGALRNDPAALVPHLIAQRHRNH